MIREEFYNGIIIQEYEEYMGERPFYGVLGIPESGLVSSIATSHLINMLGLKEVGGIDSIRYFPPVTVVHNGDPKPPMRIFYKDHVMAIVSEVPINPSGVHPLMIALIDYLQKKRCDHIIVPMGIAVPNRMEIEKPSVYWIVSRKESEELVKNLNAKRLEEGFLAGPYAVLLKEARRRGVSAVLLMAESFLEFPDPAAAAAVLDVMSKILNVEIDVKPLLEKAEEIRLKTRELMQHTRHMLTQMKKGYEQQMPLMYV